MKRVSVATGALLIIASLHTSSLHARASKLGFEVTIAAGLISTPQNGRLFVVLSSKNQPEPRFTIGETGLDASPVFGHDIGNFAPGVIGKIDESSAAFPIESLAHLPAGDYFVQALFDSNIDVKSLNAPGNLYSTP